jgi:hypothetical protein
MMLRNLLWIGLVLAVGCGETKVTEVHQSPVATITSHADGAALTEGEFILLQGSVSDADTEFEDLLAGWYAEGREICAPMAPDGSGTTTCADVEITVDIESIRLEVKDTTSLIGIDDVSVNVAANSAPTISFLAPEDSAEFASGATIAIEAQVADAEDAPDALTLSLTHTTGEMTADLEFAPTVSSDGGVNGTIILDEGVHTLTLTVVDTAGKQDFASVVDITVLPENEAPTCGITAPSDGDAGESGVLVTLVGAVADADQDANTLSVEWSSDKDETLGTSTPDSDGSIEFSTSTLSVNTHQLTLTVTDAGGQTCSDSVSFTVGQGPTVSIVQPSSGDSFGPGTVVVFEGAVSDTEDTPSELTVVWASDRDGELSTAAPDASGTTQFTLNTTDDALTIGSHTVTLTVTDTDGLSVSDLVSIEVTDNNVPEILAVSISPDPPAPTDTLTCSWTFSDADGDDDVSTASWTMDGVEVGTSPTLSGIFESGDSVTCTVTPNDGMATGTPVSATVVIDNTTPSLTDVSITPDPANIDDTLTCAWVFDDADGDADVSTLSWTVGGVEVGTSADLAGAFVGGDTAVCTVTPSDGIVTGTPMTASITIDNTLPTVSTVSISPDPAGSTDTLTCSWAFDDRDGDGDTSTVSWTVGGTEVGTTSTLSGVFGPGDEVVCTVTAFDGSDTGSEASASITIGNATPEVSAVTISPDPALATDTLACSWTWADADDDEDVSTVSWTVDGAEVGTGTTLSGAFGAGDTVVCTVTPNDGTDTGTPQSDSVVISNTAPSIVGVYITPEPATADDELECVWIGYADAEDDPDESVPDWYINGIYAASGVTFSGGFAKTNTVTCSVTPFDGFAEGDPISDTITIQNKEPEIVSVEISPATPSTDDALVAVVETFDVDGDTPDLDYVWTLDGSSSGVSATDTVAAVDTARDQEWMVTVTPDDGEDVGAPMSSGSVFIDNTAPSAPAVAITPAAPVTETDDLFCEIVTDSTDPDLDSISYSFAWTVDGSAYSGTTGSTDHSGDTVPVASTDYLQTWTCTATPSDGSLEGGDASDSVVTSCQVLTWYADTDGDGYGDDLDTLEQCDAPAGYVAVGGDCVTDDSSLVECPSDGDSDWTRVDGTEPVAWSAVGMDTANDRILVYGGQTYHSLSDGLFAYSMATGEWDISTGVTGADPGTRKGHASVFVEGVDFGELVVFGGEDYHTLTDEVFVLDATAPGAENWTDLTTTPPPGSYWPEPRTGASMVYDPEDDVVLMFGGRGYYGLLSDLWEMEFSGTEASWTELIPDGDIPERAFSSAVYDPNYDVVYAFGGEQYHALADTVACLDLETLTWSNASVTGDAIAALTDTAAVYAPDYRAIVLYGGQGYHALPDLGYYIEPTGPCSLTVSALDPGEGTSPGGLAGAGIVWDSEDDVAMLVGGQSYYALSESIYSLTP